MISFSYRKEGLDRKATVKYMKKIKFLCLMLSLLLILAAFASCQTTPPDENSGDTTDNQPPENTPENTPEVTPEPTEPESEIKLGGVPLKEFKIVVPKSTGLIITKTAKKIAANILEATGIELEIVKDDTENDYEIIVGQTAREESAAVYSKDFKYKEYAINVAGYKIAIGGSADEFTMGKAAEDLCGMIIESGAVVSKTAVAEAKQLLTSACFSDSHNNFAMLEPTNNTKNYVFRKTHAKAIDLILETRGPVDVVVVGGDLMSDYPHWNQSGWLPYEYYLGFKEVIVSQFERLSKDGKVLYVAGNHDYAQGELSTDGPGIGGSYNSSEFYFTGPMNEKVGTLAEEDMHWITGTHTGEKYLLGYHYEINGVHFMGIAPDPDAPGIWSKQEYGFHPDTLKWFEKTLKRIDPNNHEIIFVNCHYHLASRSNDKLSPTGQADKDILPIIKSHTNLFWLYGHLHTGIAHIAQSHTSEMIVHYNKSGVALDTPAISESYKTVSGRGPTTVYMGAGRIDYDAKYFDNERVYGYGGFDYRTAVTTTATPTVCQVMYFTVYEDRVEFQSINVGSYEGHSVDDIVEPYTVYFYQIPNK